MVGKPVEKGGFDIFDYGITIVLQRKLQNYVKNIPQHIRAAKMLPLAEQKALTPGSFISFVKTRSKEGIKPVDYGNIRRSRYPKIQRISTEVHLNKFWMLSELIIRKY